MVMGAKRGFGVEYNMPIMFMLGMGDRGLWSLRKGTSGLGAIDIEETQFREIWSIMLPAEPDDVEGLMCGTGTSAICGNQQNISPSC